MNRITIKMPLDGTTLEQKDALIQKALHILSELLEKSTNATTLTIEEDGAAVKKYDTAIDNISSPYPEAKKSYQDFPKIKLKNIKKEKKKAKISRHKEKSTKRKGRRNSEGRSIKISMSFVKYLNFNVRKDAKTTGYPKQLTVSGFCMPICTTHFIIALNFNSTVYEV